MQKRYRWKLKHRELELGERTLLMGILNVTPDSFSDGGAYDDPDRAVARAVELEEQGADILDIGAESTRPGSARISEAEELRRLIPVLKRLRDKLSIPISVDTYKSGVAEKALEYGAEIINDPTGILLDQQLPRVVAKWDAGLVINHMRGTPETWSALPPIQNLMRSLTIDLEAAIHRSRQGGVQKHQLVLDPGLGFGKRREQNSEILARLQILTQFDLPLLVGPSRKSFLRQEQEQLTEFATAGALAASVLNGAHVVRVHDVRAMRVVADVVDMVRHYTELAEPEPEPKRQPTENRRPSSLEIKLPGSQEARPASGERRPATESRPADESGRPISEGARPPANGGRAPFNRKPPFSEGDSRPRADGRRPPFKGGRPTGDDQRPPRGPRPFGGGGRGRSGPRQPK